MLTYQKLKKQPERFLSLTSLTVEEFEELLVSFIEAWRADIEKRAYGKQRKRKPGGGRKPALNRDDQRLLFILIYFKLYPLQQVQGLLFEMSQGQANDWIQRLTPILQATLKQQALLPERDPANLEQVLQACDFLEFRIDGTERRRQRPVDPKQQRDYYSGKKKTHTLTNDMIVHPASGHVCYLSKTYPGRRHDKGICDEEGYTFPALAQLFQDTGFQGYAPAGALVYQPKKKPRGVELDLADRFINSIISSSRIIVEHVICGVKRLRILKDTFRNHLKDFDDTVIEIACGLHNFRLRHRHPVPDFNLFDLVS